ncbi:hypothetical protein BOTU111921_02900 [Bordetella tumbae]
MTSPEAASMTAVVTGANKGIGYAIAHVLGRGASGQLMPASRPRWPNVILAGPLLFSGHF